MKPGNLQWCKVPNPAVVYRKMRVHQQQRSADRGAFFVPNQRGETNYGKETFYF